MSCNHYAITYVCMIYIYIDTHTYITIIIIIIIVVIFSFYYYYYYNYYYYYYIIIFINLFIYIYTHMPVFVGSQLNAHNHRGFMSRTPLLLRLFLSFWFRHTAVMIWKLERRPWMNRFFVKPGCAFVLRGSLWSTISLVIDKDLTLDWIGSREILQGKPIFHGKIYGFR